MFLKADQYNKETSKINFSIQLSVFCNKGKNHHSVYLKN